MKETVLPRQRDMAMIFLLAVVAYAPALVGGFHFDDFNVIVYNPAVHSLAAWLSDLGSSGVRPALKLSYALNWMSGAGAFGFHLTNVCVHALSALVCLFLFMELTRGLMEEREAYLASLFAALLFALHPVQTEAVSYISGRSASLMSLLYLSSLLFYARGSRNRSALLVYLISPGLFVLAVATKEVAVTLPAALLLWDISKGIRPRDMLKRQGHFWLLVLALLALILMREEYRYLIGVSLLERGVRENLLSQINGVFYLSSRLAFIWDLNIDPDLPVIVAWDFLLVAKLAFLASILAVGVIGMRRHPVLGFGLAWFFLQLLPTNSVLARIDMANERHLYLANAGVFLSLGSLAARPAATSRLVTWAMVLTLVALSSFTVLRGLDYRSEIALWEDTVAKSPLKPRPYNNLGVAYENAGRTDEARRMYLRALELKPDYEVARRNLDRSGWPDGPG